MSKLLIGTSAWSDHDPFYPPGLKSAEQLPYYARYFPVVEVNTTYYRVPTRRMVENWVSRTPDNFVFDVKPPRELTSTPEAPRGEAPEPDADVASAFAEAIEPLAEAGKLGAVTFQFPPSYRNTEEHREYIRLLPELMPGMLISVEFRRRDWLDDEHAEETIKLLDETGLSYTMADEPQMGSGSVPPVYAITNPKLAIIRFHGRNYETWLKPRSIQLGVQHRRTGRVARKDQLGEGGSRFDPHLLQHQLRRPGAAECISPHGDA
jgi:uncharacterized protein YecE (DUF72 family)